VVLLDETFLRKLDRLSLPARRVRAGQIQGERRSTRRGTSVEFADYRSYARGDDLRRVDWNIYARLERPFVKLFEEEEDLAVTVLLDASASMAWQEAGTPTQAGDGPDGTKWICALQLAAALGTIALAGGDRLSVLALRPTPGERFGPARGRGHTLPLLGWLQVLRADGTTDLNASLRTHASSAGRAGLTLLISDLFSPAGFTEGLAVLAARGHEVAVLHLLSPAEVEPPLEGDLRLVDVETGEPEEVTLDGATQALYRQRLAAWREGIRRTCHVRGAHYVSVQSDTPIERVVLTDLRRSGVVR
jgi:uncharacterized protein (DUF58 family)